MIEPASKWICKSFNEYLTVQNLVILSIISFSSEYVPKENIVTVKVLLVAMVIN